MTTGTPFLMLRQTCCLLSLLGVSANCLAGPIASFGPSYTEMLLLFILPSLIGIALSVSMLFRLASFVALLGSIVATAIWIYVCVSGGDSFPLGLFMLIFTPWVYCVFVIIGLFMSRVSRSRETSKQQATPEEVTDAHPTDEELMRKHGITRVGEKFHFTEYRYDRLKDAIAYAELQQRREQSN